MAKSVARLLADLVGVNSIVDASGAVTIAASGGSANTEQVENIVDGKLQVVEIIDFVGGDGTPGQALLSAGDGTVYWGSSTSSSLSSEDGTVVISDNLSVDGSISLTDVTLDPEVFSFGSLNLTANSASGRVEVTQTPFKLASFTSSARDELTAENGDLIYNTTTNKFQGYANGTWVDLH